MAFPFKAAAILLTGLLAAPALARAVLDDGWWIVLGSSPDPDYTALSHPVAAKAAAAAKRCGVVPYGDFSGKWTGFAPGLFVEVAGAYATRAEAERRLRLVQRCLPGAYLRHGRYAGD